MTNDIRIGLIGDFNPQVKANVAIPEAIALAAQEIKQEVEVNWLATTLLEHSPETLRSGYDALWCVPASPYASMEGALTAIRFAREQGIPFLGTCGGSQHALIEYARNVLGLTEADHAESNPSTAFPLIAPLLCALVEASDTILLKPGSRIATIYGVEAIVEQYHCSFGLNSQYLSLFEQSSMHITDLEHKRQLCALELHHNHMFLCA